MTPRRARKLTIPLPTGRLMLEPITYGHAPALFPILHDPRTQQWNPSPRATTLDELRQEYADAEDGHPDPSRLGAGLTWAVRLADPHRYVGKIDVTVATTRWAINVGYIIAPGHWGHGYATEALQAVVDYLWTLKVKGCIAYVRPGNVASCRVLQRVGFASAGMVLDDEQFKISAPT